MRASERIRPGCGSSQRYTKLRASARTTAAILLLDLRARQLDQFSVFDARGAGRLARAAIEAAIDVRDERVAQFQAALIHEQHLPHAPARRIRFLAPQPVGGAVIEAEPAVNAARIIFVARMFGGAEPAESFLEFLLRIGNGCGRRGGHDFTILPRSVPEKGFVADRKAILFLPSAENLRAGGPRFAAKTSTREGTTESWRGLRRLRWRR